MRSLLRTTTLSLLTTAFLAGPALALGVGGGAGTGVGVGGGSSAGIGVGSSTSVGTSSSTSGIGVNSGSSTTASGTGISGNTSTNADINSGTGTGTSALTAHTAPAQRGIPQPEDGLSHARSVTTLGTGADQHTATINRTTGVSTNGTTATSAAMNHDLNATTNLRARHAKASTANGWSPAAGVNNNLSTSTSPSGSSVSGSTGATATNPGGSPDMDMRANTVLGH